MRNCLWHPESSDWPRGIFAGVSRCKSTGGYDACIRIDIRTISPASDAVSSARRRQAGPIGGRALEILLALFELGGKLVSKQDFDDMGLAECEPANLTVHMSAQRRALCDGPDGNRRRAAA